VLQLAVTVTVSPPEDELEEQGFSKLVSELVMVTIGHSEDDELEQDHGIFLQ
jgi:hypothetical protein